jgi:16S rRNA processing protein RimM
LEPPERVRIGYIRRAVGLAGEVEVEPLTDDPGRFRSGLSVQAGSTRRQVEAVRGGAKTLVLKLAGVDDRGSAEGLRGQYLEIETSEAKPLPEGSYYHWQLVGLDVVDVGGRSLGRLADVLEYPANDVYVVSNGGAEILVPAIAEVIRRIDLGAGRMVVDLPEEVVVA